MPVQDIVLETSQEQWTIETGGEKGSGRSVMAARHDDDDLFAKKLIQARLKMLSTKIVKKSYIYVYV